MSTFTITHAFFLAGVGFALVGFSAFLVAVTYALGRLVRRGERQHKRPAWATYFEK